MPTHKPLKHPTLGMLVYLETFKHYVGFAAYMYGLHVVEYEFSEMIYDGWRFHAFLNGCRSWVL